MRIVVLPGDGIGPEISAATYSVLRAASERFQLNVQTEEHAVGHASLEQFGTTVRPGLLEIVKAADALILGPAATFDFKDEQSGEINPSKYLPEKSGSVCECAAGPDLSGFAQPAG